MKNIKSKLAITFVCFVLGIALTLQFRTVKEGIGSVSISRARELTAQLKKLNEEREILLKTKSEYEKRITDYENAVANSSSAARILKEELERNRILSGIEDVIGPGIIVRLDDLKFGEKIDFPMIDYVMLLEILNELNGAGAEAISINEQRIITATEIIQNGIYININTVKCIPPFIINVIGNPKALEEALRLREGVLENYENHGVTVTIMQDQNIKIAKYSGIIERKYSKVFNKGVTQ